MAPREIPDTRWACLGVRGTVLSCAHLRLSYWERPLSVWTLGFSRDPLESHISPSLRPTVGQASTARVSVRPWSRTWTHSCLVFDCPHAA